MHRLHAVGKAPLAIAGVIAMPLFFASLMAVSLAIEKPVIRAQWHNGKGVLISVFDAPAAWAEARIWLLALAVAALVVLAGAIGVLFRGGVVLVGAVAIVLAAGLMVRIDRWTEHHTDRFPYGADLIRDSSISNILLKGEWEQSARSTAIDLSWVTIGMGAAAILGFAFLEVRRRRGRRIPELEEPPAPLDARGAPDVVRRSG